MQHFPSSPRVFRKNELTRLTVENRMGVLLHQLSAFISGTGSFAGGVQLFAGKALRAGTRLPIYSLRGADA
jgi:hypothetical protein